MHELVGHRFWARRYFAKLCFSHTHMLRRKVGERVMIERSEKEDIEIQIYKDVLITSDEDRKMRESISLNPNLQRYIDNNSTTLHEWERKYTKK